MPVDLNPSMLRSALSDLIANLRPLIIGWRRLNPERSQSG